MDRDSAEEFITDNGVAVRRRISAAASQIPRIGNALSIASCILGALVLYGYAIGYQPAWRLAPGMPAVNPVTAFCFALLGYGCFAGSGEGRAFRLAARAAVVAVAALVTLRALTPSISGSFFQAITPFKDILAAEAAAGRPINMGMNSAHVLLLVAAAEMLRWKRRNVTSQMLACGAGALLFMAFMGYLYGLPTFYGTMAPTSLIGALCLVLSSLIASRKFGFIRALVAHTEPGRIARLLLSSSTFMILFIGWLTVHNTRAHGLSMESSALIAYQTAAIIILSWVLVTTATVQSDIIDQSRRSAEASLLLAATTDALTGLLSRNHLEHYRSAAQGPSIATMAELYIDLDRFRMVNYTFGTGIADEFLVEIGQRLRSVAGCHPVGRLGGDEFSICCEGVSLEEALLIGAAVTATLAMPFTKRGRSFHLTASVGIGHGATAGGTDLRRASNNAMHVAKRRGGNQLVVFERSMFEAQRIQVDLEQYLYDALGRDDELTLAFQPVVDVASQSLMAVEALARWTHPELGPIPPGRFIEVAERSGLANRLGLKLMGFAVDQAALWRDRYGERAPRININISPIQFATGDVIGDLKRKLDRYGLRTSAICIEVTESAFSDAHAVSALQRACDMGFTVAMDDFGIGYSSLSQLPRLPISTVKLDRSFIVEATDTNCGARLLASITQLAHGLDLKVVAEGVETEAQLALVADIGCDAVQGYIYARPLSPADFQVWFAESMATTRQLEAAEA